MADISIPGVKSRFDTENLIEGLMKVQRIPRDRLEKNVESLESQKTTWQSLGRRISLLKDAANELYSFQNPFNERTTVSSDSSVLEASATREVRGQSHNFVVKQTALADKFISRPLPASYEAPAGNYGFSAGESKAGFTFPGGSLEDFSKALNAGAKDVISSSVVAVRAGTKSLVIESLVTGRENRLDFSEDALKLGVDTGLVVKAEGGPEVIKIPAVPVRNPGEGFMPAGPATDVLRVAPLTQTQVALNKGILPTSTMFLRFTGGIADNTVAVRAASLADKNLVVAQNALEAAKAENALARGAVRDAAAALAGARSALEETKARLEAARAESARNEAPAESAPAGDAAGQGDAAASGGGASELSAAESGGAGVQEADGTEAAGGAEVPDERSVVSRLEELLKVRQDELSLTEKILKDMQARQTEAGAKVDAAELDLANAESRIVPVAETTDVLKIYFEDGSFAELDPIEAGSKEYSYNLFELSGGKTVTMLGVDNQNTLRDVTIRDIEIEETAPKREIRPVTPVTEARDAVLLMDGIEITRPSNNIDDLIPGMTLKVHAASDEPVSVEVREDAASVKDAVIRLVGSYNRLMVELNVLTRNDEAVINEVSYLDASEREELKARLGELAGDPFVTKLRTDLIGIVNASYGTEGGPALLANFGVSTDVRRAGAGGYDRSRTRGYLEIDEKALDGAIAVNQETLRQLMGRDTNGDMIVDSGLAYSLEKTARPFIETGGIVANKTGGLNSRITSDKRRIETIDRQLEQKEASLRRQYGQMEDAYNRMERMSNSLDNFNTQNTPNRR